MLLAFLGKETEEGKSPTLYATDGDSYVIQGWRVVDAEILAKLQVPDGETVVEIPPALLNHLAKDGLHGAVTSWVPPIVHVKENGNYIIQGRTVSDPDTLAGMDIPDHETCVEVSKVLIKALIEEEHGEADG